MATIKAQHLAKEVHLCDFQGLTSIYRQSHRENTLFRVTVESEILPNNLADTKDSFPTFPFEESPSKIIQGLVFLKFRRSLQYLKQIAECPDLSFRLLLLLEEMDGCVYLDFAKKICWHFQPKTNCVKTAIYKINNILCQLGVSVSISIKNETILIDQ